MQGKIIPFKAGEYSELDGLAEGSQIKFDGEATIVKTQGTEEGGEGEGSMGLQIESINMEPSDNEATQEVNRMTGKSEGPSSNRTIGTKSGEF